MCGEQVPLDWSGGMLMLVLLVRIAAAVFIKAMMVRSGFGVAPELKERVWMRLCRPTLELQRHHQNAEQREEPQPPLGLT